MEGIENPDTFSADDWFNLDALFQRMSSVDDLASKISNAIIIPAQCSSETNDLDMDGDASLIEDSVIDDISNQPNDKKWIVNPKSVHSASLSQNH